MIRIGFFLLWYRTFSIRGGLQKCMSWRAVSSSGDCELSLHDD